MNTSAAKKSDNLEYLENKKKARMEGESTQQNMTSFLTKPKVLRSPSA